MRTIDGVIGYKGIWGEIRSSLAPSQLKSELLNMLTTTSKTSESGILAIPKVRFGLVRDSETPPTRTCTQLRVFRERRRFFRSLTPRVGDMLLRYALSQADCETEWCRLVFSIPNLC